MLVQSAVRCTNALQPSLSCVRPSFGYSVCTARRLAEDAFCGLFTVLVRCACSLKSNNGCSLPQACAQHSCLYGVHRPELCLKRQPSSEPHSHQLESVSQNARSISVQCASAEHVCQDLDSVQSIAATNLFSDTYIEFRLQSCDFCSQFLHRIAHSTRKFDRYSSYRFNGRMQMCCRKQQQQQQQQQ
jgi:hypothetical protein